MFKRARSCRVALVGTAVLTSFFIQTAHAGFERRDQGARPIAMGGAFVGVADNPWAAVFNPAGLARLQEAQTSIFYSPQLFGLKELSLSSAVLAIPTALGSFGISGTRFGFELYREVSGTFSYAKTHRNIFSFGINVTYNSLTIKNYGTTSAIGVDIGFLASVTEALHWGFFAANVNAPTIGQAKEKLPQVYSTGLGYSPLRGVLIGVDLVKDVRYPAILKGGLEYRLMDVLSLRTGVGSNPTKFSSGVGAHYSFVQFDYAVTSHQELGLSHHFSVSIGLGREGG